MQIETGNWGGYVHLKAYRGKAHLTTQRNALEGYL